MVNVWTSLSSNTSSRATSIGSTSTLPVLRGSGLPQGPQLCTLERHKSGGRQEGWVVGCVLAPLRFSWWQRDPGFEAQTLVPEGRESTQWALSKLQEDSGCWWLTLAILATWEAEIRRIMVRGQPGQIVHETPSPKITRAKWNGDVLKW
jgi:hypothetical protein